MNHNKVLALILAAGRGTRMKSEIPKPLNLVYNKPIISWIINSFKKENIDIGLIINPKDTRFVIIKSLDIVSLGNYNKKPNYGVFQV